MPMIWSNIYIYVFSDDYRVFSFMTELYMNRNVPLRILVLNSSYTGTI